MYVAVKGGERAIAKRTAGLPPRGAAIRPYLSSTRRRSASNSLSLSTG